MFVKYCQVFQCMCSEVKDIIKGYDVICSGECYNCNECKDLTKEETEE